MGSLRKPLTCVFVVALVARLGAQVILGAYSHAETFEYEDITNNLLAGSGYAYMSGGITYLAAVSSPLYVLLTAGVYVLTGHSQAVVLVLQALAGAATAVLAGWLAGRAFRPEVAWTAGGIVAVDPSLAVYATRLHPLTLDALAFLAVICACVGLSTRPGWRSLGLLGVLIGLAALTRTTVLSFVPVVLLWASRYRQLALVSGATLALLLATAVVYGPWPVRNSLLLGQVVPGSSESTEWLWRGMNPNATGSSYTVDGRTMLQAAPLAFQSQIAAASEAERIGLYRDAALDFARAQPDRAMRLYLIKLKSFWVGSETTGVLYDPSWTSAYIGWFVIIALLAAIGLWTGWRQKSGQSAIVLIVVSLLVVSASQALFYVEGRHRLAVEPLLLVLSGAGLARLARYGRLPAMRHQRLRDVRNTQP